MKNTFATIAERSPVSAAVQSSAAQILSCPSTIKAALLSGLLLSSSGFTDQAQASTRGAVEQTGDWLQFIVPALTAADIAIREDRNTALDKITDMGEVFALGTVSTHTLKEAFSNTEWGTRPITAEQGEFGGKNFPSGHTTAAACPAIYHAHEYGDMRSALLLAGAAYTGYTRHHAKKHDFKAVLGAFAVCEISYHLGMGSTAKDYPYSLQPVIRAHNFGDENTDYSIGLEYSIRF